MWISYALFFALWTSISMLLIKNLLKNISPRLFYLINLAFTIPFFIILLIISGIPTFSKDFFTLILIASILDLIAGILYYKSLEISEISLIAPISSFNPVFTLIFAWLILDEKPTLTKLLGVVIIVIGAYLLNIKDIKNGYFYPLKRLFSNKGVQLFLITNLIWGLTPIFQKKALLETAPTSPFTVPFFEAVLITIFLIPLFIRNAEKIKSFTRINIKLLLFLGFMTVLGQFAALTAFSMTNLAYATAIFKLSALFSVIIGAIFLKERNIQERFIGATVMIIGTILIAL